MGAAHEIDQGHRIGRVLIAAPRQVPVRSHEDELVRIKCCRIGGIDVEDDERDAAPRGCLDDACDTHGRIETDERIVWAKRIVSDRPSRSQKCGARQPGTDDDVKRPMEKGGCGLPRRAADMKNPACDAATRATGARTWTY